MDNLNKNLSEASVNIECLVLLFIVAADVRAVSWAALFCSSIQLK